MYLGNFKIFQKTSGYFWKGLFRCECKALLRSGLFTAEQTTEVDEARAGFVSRWTLANRHVFFLSLNLAQNSRRVLPRNLKSGVADTVITL